MNVQNEVNQNFDFESHKREAIAQYQKIHPLYTEYADNVKNVLSEALKKQGIKVHSIQARAKEIDSFGKKASEHSPDDPNQPHYPSPLSDITDLAGVRVIVFLPRVLETVDSIIKSQFNVLERADKGQILIRQEKLGYASIHYLVQFKEDRTKLPEYNRYKNLTAELQVRTILQHAWAEIEHDIQYKAVETIPNSIRRRFMSLAGMLEIADREFQAIQDEDESVRKEARISVHAGKLDKVEITPDALKAYLDKKLGTDGRMRDFSYEWTARLLRNLGFTDFEQVEECTRGYNDTQLSKIAYGTRQGQLVRFEYLLIAGMGGNYLELHPWKTIEWFVISTNRRLASFRGAGVKIGSYLPPAKRITGKSS